MSEHWLYMMVNLLTLAGPLARSFEPRIGFIKRWPAILAGLLITGTIFILWDALFTHWGVWGFNDRYLLGPRLLGLPIEEWMFFLTVPYACVFTYEVSVLFIKRDVLGPHAKAITWLLVAVCLAMIGLGLGRWYTNAALGLCVILLLTHAYLLRTPWLGRFYLAYAICLLPFLLVNGVLTGMFTEEPVVWYNDLENLGVRIGTIPVEDVFYGMDLILLNLTFYLAPIFNRSRRSVISA